MPSGGIMTDHLYYLATPYSHSDPKVREHRFHVACEIAGYMMSRGLLVYSPIAHTHPIACRCELPKGWDFWGRYDRVMLGKSDVLIWVEMPGHETSTGMAAEALIAQELGVVMVRMIYPSYRTWIDGFVDWSEVAR